MVWRAASFVILAVVAPLLISLSTAFIVRGLIAIQFIFNDETNTMFRVGGILIDLLLQSIYFTALIIFTKKHLFFFALLGYQLFSVGMFLRYGSPTLFWSVFGSIDYLGLR